MGSYWSTPVNNEIAVLITKTCEQAINNSQLEAYVSIEKLQTNQVILLKTVLQDQGFDLEHREKELEISGWTKKPTPGSNLMIEKFKKMYRDVTYGPRLQTLQDQFKKYAGEYGHDFHVDKNVGSVYGEEMPVLLQNLGYRSTYEPEKNWIITKWTGESKPSQAEQELCKLLQEFESNNQNDINLVFDEMKKRIEENNYDKWLTTLPRARGVARSVIQKFQKLGYDIHPFDYFQVFEAAKTGSCPPEIIEDNEPYYIHGVCISKK